MCMLMSNRTLSCSALFKCTFLQATTRASVTPGSTQYLVSVPKTCDAALCSRSYLHPSSPAPPSTPYKNTYFRVLLFSPSTCESPRHGRHGEPRQHRRRAGGGAESSPNSPKEATDSHGEFQEHDLLVERAPDEFLWQ